MPISLQFLIPHPLSYLPLGCEMCNWAPFITLIFKGLSSLLPLCLIRVYKEFVDELSFLRITSFC